MCNIKKNNTYIVKILSEGYEGEGVARVASYPVFIKNTILGEEVEALIVKVEKKLCFGKVLRILKESPERVEAICPIFNRCGGCSLMFMSYSHQLEFKKRQVESALKRIGKIENIDILPTIGMEEPFRYRNKVQIPVGETIGFFSKRSHDIVEVNSCIIQVEEGDKIIRVLKEWISKFNISHYDEALHIGDVRNVVIRKGYNTDEIMVILVSTKIPDHTLELSKMLKDEVSSIKSVYVNLNTKRTNVVLGEENILVYGSEGIKERIFDLNFNISPHTFFQVNTMQTEVLYDKVLEYSNLSKDKIVFDAYCGVGSISLFLAKKSKFVYGIEIVEQSICDAIKNAEENGIENVEFLQGSCKDKINELIDRGVYCDCLVLDPPRKGCEEGVIESIGRIKPETIVYVSCNPATLARDLGEMVKLGYRIEKVQPVDMFPMTHHVECVVLMMRNDR